MSKVLLDVRDLRTYFYIQDKEIRAVDGVSLQISQGEVLGLVGESGCGKSVTALSLAKLLPIPPAKIVSGKVLLDGVDVFKLDEKDLQRLRGRRIAYVFQEPATSLNPVFTIGNQITEVIKLYQKQGKSEARNMAAEMLTRVGIPSARERLGSYPHQLSGGMKQRVMIAMALIGNPSLLVADEPTTALDVTIQAQILDLLGKIREERNLSILLITHDLSIIGDIADRVDIMYAGRVQEEAGTASLFAHPLHPYTKALLDCIPRMAELKKRLITIGGEVPEASSLPGGCRFHPRCGQAMSICKKHEPEMKEVERGHLVRCHLY